MTIINKKDWFEKEMIKDLNYLDDINDRLSGCGDGDGGVIYMFHSVCYSTGAGLARGIGNGNGRGNGNGIA
jgi:hypothetical protein